MQITTAFNVTDIVHVRKKGALGTITELSVALLPDPDMPQLLIKEEQYYVEELKWWFDSSELERVPKDVAERFRESKINNSIDPQS